MSRRSWAVLTVLAYVGVVLAWILAGPHGSKTPAADDGKKKPSAKETDGPDVFGLTKVWNFHLDFSAKEWDAMQPTGGMRFPGMPGGPGGPAAPPKPPEKPAADPGEPPRETHKSAFGMDFPIARGEFTAEGTTLKNVGYRYKGNGSYMPSMGKLKRNLKVELDHFDDAQRFHGQKTLNLNAGAADPTRMHEALAFAVYREAGVPAPRTAFAEVTLTVPGKYDKEYLGLYTVVEQVDKTFLKEHFKNSKGLLMKPERMRGIDYLGEDWEKYKGPYQPKH